MHCVFFHVSDFCINSSRGLGFFSEQAMESVHSDFSKTWEKFKVFEKNQIIVLHPYDPSVRTTPPW